MSERSNSGAVSKIRELSQEGAVRLVTIIASEDGAGGLELIYVLDRSGELLSIRSRCPLDEELETLSSVFAGAENLEREIIDLYGARFEGLKGGLLLRPGDLVAPMRRTPAEG
ncbi:MAG: NADH-quinone oxidoreductase subunit C [Methanomassiliicoccus sp.]|nr:NADH-quinone oxidoreductase subunit C [Methanomassiliicoccus sp.]